jgi:molybdopterin/thiamine biosynthesis adenylyltransferase
MVLNSNQIERYSRQLILKDVGVKGQKKLLDSKVLIIGMGALGSASSMYLASVGVGTIGIVDGDNVELSNLQRQVLHSESKIGKSKVQSAKETLQGINSDVNIITYETFADDTNILEIIKDYDFIIDATDRIENKFLINDACVLAKKPFSHAGILQFTGQLMTYVPNESPCYRCMFEDIPKDDLPNCSQVGVLGAVCGVIGNLQALECIKYLLGVGELLTGKILTFDGLTMQFRTINFNHSKFCRVCGESADIKELSWYREYNSNSCGG